MTASAQSILPMNNSCELDYSKPNVPCVSGDLFHDPLINRFSLITH